jgi:serine/threonine protein kinase
MALDGPPPGPPASSGNLTSEPSGGRHIGEYSLQRELGRGGMGAVYLAVHDVTHEKVALKELLMTAAADPVAVQRFLQEGAVMSRLTHPNIVGVRGIIEAGLGHYIALELVEGGSLRDLLKGGPLPIPQAFAVMHGLLQALDHAHQHGIVHRDVKPENVLLSSGGQVKVADFGIARLTDDSPTSSATKTGTTVGTPQYMSPEQVTTSKVDGRSDLYSAGVACFEVFCGRPPFEATAADGPFTLFAKHVQAPPPPPTVIRPGLDPALETVILKSLSKRPDDRYQTGAEFDRELAAIAIRLCGPNWIHSLEPGANLSEMVPGVAATMVLPTAQPLPIVQRDYAPSPPSHDRTARRDGRSNRVLIAAVAGAVLVAGLTVGIIALNQRLGVGAATPPIGSSSAPTAAGCDFLKRGAAPMPNSGGDCGVKVGSQLQADSFAGLLTLPGDLSGTGIDSDTAPRGSAAIPVSGGVATLAANTRGAGVGVMTPPMPADEVVIADFTPTTTGSANIGIGLRCGSTDCILVYVSPEGRAWIMQRAGGTAPVLKFSENVDVQVNRANRLVVAVRGSQVTSWLNGILISSVGIDAGSAGVVTFFDTNQGTTPSATSLSGLYVFALAG